MGGEGRLPRRRGSKQRHGSGWRRSLQVASSRRRGLKPRSLRLRGCRAGVASYRGARIEIPARLLPAWRVWHRPLTGARIETARSRASSALAVIASSRGRGSKPPPPDPCGCCRGSPPHRGADRNFQKVAHGEIRDDRPLTGARIETPVREGAEMGEHIAPSRGRGSKHRHPSGRAECRGRLLTGGGRVKARRGLGPTGE